MKKRSKRYKESFSTFDRTKRYSLNESIKLLSKFAKAKYDEAITLSFQLGIRPEQSNEMVRGTVALPHGTGKKVRVLCFAKGEAQKAAETAGADFVGTIEVKCPRSNCPHRMNLFTVGENFVKIMK